MKRRGLQRAWVSSELKRLRELYPHTVNHEIAKLLNRSTTAIQSMASEIGLRKAVGSTPRPLTSLPDVDRLFDRIEELEGLLGLNLKLPNEFGLTPTEMKCLGAIVRRGVVNQEGLFTAIYGNRPESDHPDIKIIEVYLCRVRRKLAQRGYALKNSFGVGYYFEPGERDALKQLCAA